MTYRVGIDTGGTFTDYVLLDPALDLPRILKYPTSRADTASAVLASLRALLEREDLAGEGLRFVLHGTTLALNTIVERRDADILPRPGLDRPSPARRQISAALCRAGSAPRAQPEKLHDRKQE